MKVQIWSKVGPKVGPKWVQSWSKVGPMLVQSWSKFGPKLVQSWSKVGPMLVQCWSKVGPKLVQSWSKVGPKLVQSWSKVGLRVLGLSVPGSNKTAAVAVAAAVVVVASTWQSSHTKLGFELWLGLGVAKIWESLAFFLIKPFQSHTPVIIEQECKHRNIHTYHNTDMEKCDSKQMVKFVRSG